MYTHPNTAEQCLHNVLKVVEALKHIGLDYDVQVRKTHSIFLFLTHAYETLQDGKKTHIFAHPRYINIHARVTIWRLFFAPYSLLPAPSYHCCLHFLTILIFYSLSIFHQCGSVLSVTSLSQLISLVFFFLFSQQTSLNLILLLYSCCVFICINGSLSICRGARFTFTVHSTAPSPIT